MGSEQTRDVLEAARRFHHQVSLYFHQLESQTAQERIRMLLEYVSRHEEHLSESLADYAENASAKVLDTWFKSKHSINILETLSDVKLTPDMSVDDVIDVGLRVDDCLIAVYQDLAQNAESQEVRDVFQNLLTLEQREKCQLARNAVRVLDF